MNNHMHYNDMACENETLRERYRAIKQKAEALSDAVERYTHQGISRSMLLHIKADLDRTINPTKTSSI